VNESGHARARIGVGVPLAVAGVVFLIEYLQKLPCRAAGWQYRGELLFGKYCYSDISVLYRSRGLIEGIFPYSPEAHEHPLEYPVITGLVMDWTARFTRWLTPGASVDASSQAYYEVNVILLAAFALAVVAGTWLWLRRTGGRPGDALLVAAAPSLVFAATINWDLVAVAAGVFALVAWAYDRPVVAGVLIGLGTAAKLFPAFLFLPLLLLAIRTRRFAPLRDAVAAALVSWTAVNLPLLIRYPDGWLEFWRFNVDRGADFGSIWYALLLQGIQVPSVSSVATLALLALCAAIVFVALRAHRTPTLAQLAFLTVAAFLLTNKVYSPQYVVWLLPLAVLARAGAPVHVAVRDWAIWQAAEVTYWAMVWKYLEGSLGDYFWAYPVSVYVRVAVTLYLCAQVVRDIMAPSPTLAPAAVPRTAQVTPNLRQVEPSTENAV
jgi:uncharacterized membrane protein